MVPALSKFAITPPKHVIDCETDPFIPVGWQIDEHRRSGQLTWDALKLDLVLSDEQQNGKQIEGYQLRQELRARSVCNANVLDYLLRNPQLIPQTYKSKYVFFWGTIYCPTDTTDSRLFVRYLFWYAGRWGWLHDSLGHAWSGNDPAAVSSG